MTERPPTKGQSPSLADAVWLNEPATQEVMAALKRAGHGARVVGGAVRNALIGLPVKDIDIATTATPPETIASAKAARLKTFETGIAHGTVTVVAHHTPIEVTTLRRDVETDGRHARVAFTSDWAEDAGRRDFTINALYCDGNGTVHDPLGQGLEDLAQRRVCFIGRAEDRIREDYLRILRFFRFTAEYAEGDPDPVGLNACIALKDGISNLSGERRRTELLRILATQRAPAILALMHESGVLTPTLGFAGDPGLLTRVTNIESSADLPSDPLLRLGAVALTKPGAASALRASLKLSSAEDDRLSQMALPDRAFDPASNEHAAKAYIYRHGALAFRDGVMLAWARSASDANDADWLHRLRLTQRWQAPELPVRGADVLALGVAPGPEVGRILSEFEDWWIASAFPMTPALLAKRLQLTVTKS
jgi:poly(A) polymerase